MARNLTVQILRGVLANIPSLSLGEFYLATDTKAVYIGTSSGNTQIGGSSGLTGSIVDGGSSSGPFGSGIFHLDFGASS